jgi:hypothetical protein
MAMTSHRVVMTLLGLSMLGFSSTRLAGQAADSSTRRLRAVVTSLPPATAVRLTAGGRYWSGRVARRLSDSLALTDESGMHVLSLEAIDTLWVRGPRKTEALMAGAAFGAIMFGVLQLSRDEGEDPGLRTRLGLILFLGAATGGVLVDAVSDRWVRNYPE